MPSRLVVALALAWWTAASSLAYQDFARREGLSCSACHSNEVDFALTAKGTEYKDNGYRFEVRRATPATPSPTDQVAAVDPRTVTPLVRGMRRSQDALKVTASALAEGRYGAAVEGARRLQDLAGRFEGHYRAGRRAAADQARVMRDAAYRLERTLRAGGTRRVSVAPIQLGQVMGACLNCHVQEGLTEEDWRMTGRPPAGPSGLPSRRRAPASSRR